MLLRIGEKKTLGIPSPGRSDGRHRFQKVLTCIFIALITSQYLHSGPTLRYSSEKKDHESSRTSSSEKSPSQNVSLGVGADMAGAFPGSELGLPGARGGTIAPCPQLSSGRSRAARPAPTNTKHSGAHGVKSEGNVHFCVVMPAMADTVGQLHTPTPPLLACRQNLPPITAITARWDCSPRLPYSQACDPAVTNEM